MSPFGIVTFHLQQLRNMTFDVPGKNGAAGVPIASGNACLYAVKYFPPFPFIHSSLHAVELLACSYQSLLLLSSISILLLYPGSQEDLGLLGRKQSCPAIFLHQGRAGD